MFNSSPIESWDGAGVFYSFANTAGTDLFFWLTVILLVVPLYFTLKTENHHENHHN